MVALRVFGLNKVDYVAIPGLQCSFPAAIHSLLT